MKTGIFRNILLMKNVFFHSTNVTKMHLKMRFFYARNVDFSDNKNVLKNTKLRTFLKTFLKNKNKNIFKNIKKRFKKYKNKSVF